MAIPGSNAFVERVFSLANSQWTDVRNKLKVETVKAILQVKVNFDGFSCEDMHKYILENRNLIKQIQSGEKYHHRSLTN